MTVPLLPNNSLMLTRRASGRLTLVFPATTVHSPGNIAHCRRAA